MLQFHVYIQKCRDGSYYTGHTDDMDKRLWEHEQGLAADWTRRRRPLELVWCDWTGSRDEALAFERQVKRWSRAKKEALIAGHWERVGYFARPPHERPSTSLGTNGVGESQKSKAELGPISESFVPSEVEVRTAECEGDS